MSYEFFVQLIGMIGCSLGVVAFLSKRDLALRVLLGSAAMFMSVHFILLGSLAGAGSFFLTGTRSFMSALGKMKPYAPLFFLPYIPLAFYVVHSWVEVLPIVTGILGTYAMFYMGSIGMRVALMVCSSLWLIHHIFYGSIGGIALEIFIISANAITLTRLYMDQKREAQLFAPLRASFAFNQSLR